MSYSWLQFLCSFVAAIALSTTVFGAGTGITNLDLGGDEWFEDAALTIPITIGNTSATSPPAYSAAQTFYHSNGQTTMTVTPSEGNSLGNAGPDGALGTANSVIGYEFTSTQTRTSFDLDDGGTIDQSVGGDFSQMEYTINFGDIFVYAGTSVNGAACDTTSVTTNTIPANALDGLNISSQNGTSEAYEYGVFALSAASVVNNPNTYDPNNYNSLTMSEHVAGVAAAGSSSPAPYIYGYDQFNSTIDNSAAASTTNPDSGSGSTSSSDLSNAGAMQTAFSIAATDTTPISGFTWYGGAMDISLALQASGFSHTNTSPSAGLNGIDFLDTSCECFETVPEPNAILLLGAGFLALFGLRRRR